MSLNDKNVDSADIFLGEQKVIVAVDGGRADLLIAPCEQNLVVVAIYD